MYLESDAACGHIEIFKKLADIIVLIGNKNNWKSETFNKNTVISFSLKTMELLNESHPRVFQTITLSFFIAFKARQG